MRRKKTEGQSPDIIVTFNFNTSSSVQSFGRFADYVSREQATALEQEAEQVFEEHLEGEDYKKMIAYMKRDAAIVQSSEREKRTGLFNACSQNITGEELETLKNKLEDAQRRGNNLWNGAVSFDIGFLIQIGVLEYDAPLEAKIALADKKKKRLEAQDKERVKKGEKRQNARAIYLAKKELEKFAKQRKVDQERLKQALQEQMGSFLKAEGFNDTAFWWGSVHLNTKHVHVHVSVSETENSRKRVLNPATGEREPRGKFKVRNIERLKSKIFHSLDIGMNKKQRIKNEIEVGVQREAILSAFEKTEISEAHILLDFYLEEAQKRLPEEGRVSFKSNRKDFREAKAYLEGFIDTYLETVAKDEFHLWREATKKQLTEYENTYSESFDLEKLLLKREKTLREHLGNKLLKQLKEREAPSREKAQDYLSTEDYKQIIDDLKAKEMPSKELGKLKYLLKVSQAEDHEILYKQELSKLQKFETVEANRALKNYHQTRLVEKIKLSQMEQWPRLKLSFEEQEERKALQLKYVRPRDLKIAQATPAIVQGKMAQIDEEIEAIRKTRDKTLLSHLYHKTSRKEIIDALQKEKTMLHLKATIQKNNQSGNRKENHVLFKELKQLYGAFEEKEGQVNRMKRKEEFHKASRGAQFLAGLKNVKRRPSSSEWGARFETLSQILAQLDVQDRQTAQAKRAQKVSDEREERER